MKHENEVDEKIYNIWSLFVEKTDILTFLKLFYFGMI